jgi:hypothetical protein
MTLIVDHNVNPSELSRGQIIQDMINTTQGMCAVLMDLELIDSSTYIRNESSYYGWYSYCII